MGGRAVGLFVGAGSKGLGVDGLYVGTLIVGRIGSIGTTGTGFGVLTKCGGCGCIGLYGVGVGVGAGVGLRVGACVGVLGVIILPVGTFVMPFTGLSVLIVIAGTFG